MGKCAEARWSNTHANTNFLPPQNSHTHRKQHTHTHTQSTHTPTHCITSQTYHEDAEVMVDVQEAQLGPLAAEDDEDSVEKVEDLGQVEHPDHRGHAGLRVVHRVADERVVLGLVFLDGGVDHPAAQVHLQLETRLKRKTAVRWQ